MAELVGERIEVLFDDPPEYFAGVVTRYAEETGLHGVRYDDGTNEECDLSSRKTKYRLVRGEGVASRKLSRTPASQEGGGVDGNELQAADAEPVPERAEFDVKTVPWLHSASLDSLFRRSVIESRRGPKQNIHPPFSLRTEDGVEMTVVSLGNLVRTKAEAKPFGISQADFYGVQYNLTPAGHVADFKTSGKVMRMEVQPSQGGGFAWKVRVSDSHGNFRDFVGQDASSSWAKVALSEHGHLWTIRMSRWCGLKAFGLLEESVLDAYKDQVLAEMLEERKSFGFWENLLMARRNVESYQNLDSGEEE
ncbi:hypothetical protein HOP50_02g19420 [Chloropicon primus]|uniref:PTM/DIR17-like Tudor domain-containing protein n=1 Tax=Chloropicon primus TaxID=1764295 RepID=A0A5B8MGA7_9CHLO|nr:hypothetical protein A3770_02p19450 [Chloropicon primus]UPQ98636.1 hypothetical protein HOP50_02g19420 [Chloropicon primus]|eukprot:QDZ19427.1 hypothetical protein A3770_02p19450 [Chloropicon primus]